MNERKETQKNTFSRITGFLRGSFKQGELYSEEMELRALLLDPKTKETCQPQVLQGMWQAYGQMRSARTRGQFAVLATGIIGLGLFAYRLFLDEKNKELRENQAKLKQKVEEAESQKIQIKFQEKALIEREKYLADDEGNYSKLLEEYKILDAQLKLTHEFVLTVCKDDSNCLSEYKRWRESNGEHINDDNKEIAGIRHKV